jgi:hypothetical protein
MNMRLLFGVERSFIDNQLMKRKKDFEEQFCTKLKT